MYEVLQVVRLRCDSPEHGLIRGTTGTVLLVHGNGEAYEIEVADDQGRPTFLGALPADLLEPG